MKPANGDSFIYNLKAFLALSNSNIDLSFNIPLIKLGFFPNGQPISEILIYFDYIFSFPLLVHVTASQLHFFPC